MGKIFFFHKMRKLQIFLLVLFSFYSFILSYSAFGANLFLTATWTANTEPDIREYRLYRIDGTRTRIGTTLHPNTSCPFMVTVPDQSSGTLRFVLTAVDQTNNESPDSNPASYSYNVISGNVRTSGGTGMSGVVMNGLPSNPTTDSNGYYSDMVSSGWSGTVAPSRSGYAFSPSSRSYSNVTSNQTTQDYTVAVSYTYTVTTTPPGLQIIVDGASYTGPYTFYWAPGSSHTVSAPSPQSGSQGDRYKFANWNDYASQSRTITAPSASTTYTATFNKEFSLTSSVNMAEGGKVNPSGENWYKSDQTVYLSLTTNAGYKFTGWSGDLSGTSTSVPIKLDKPKNVVANFAVIVEEISVPTRPSNYSSGWFTGTSYSFNTSGASSNLGYSHSVEYQYDWGNGTLSSWGSSSQSYMWMVAGTYQVMVRARCKNHPDKISGWSSALSISVVGKPFIRVTSPNGGENWVVGTTHSITWESSYLNTSGAIYIFYWYDGAWHPIGTLSSGSTSFSWTLPRNPVGVTSPAPSSYNWRTSVWIGNWVNGSWECWDSSDQSFMVLYDAWVCKMSGGEQGGMTLLFDEGVFDGYGISIKLGMFGIGGSYSVNGQGSMSGTYTVYDFADPSKVYYSGNLTGKVVSNYTSHTLTLAFNDLNGATVFNLSGERLLKDAVIPGNWTGTLSGSAKGALNPLTIDPYELGAEVYSYVFELLGSGSLTGGGGINLLGYFYFTATKPTSYYGTNVYGIYEITGAVNEVGTLTGTLNPTSGTISFTMTSSNGNKYTLSGQKVTP